MAEDKTCINCGRELVRHGNTRVCLHCNSDVLTASEIFLEPDDNDGYVVIECPGATLYKPGTDEIEAGVRFHDDNDPGKGYEIVKHPVYAPTHERKRRIKTEAYGKIRRCRGCQDFTVRMRRPEGPDLYLPSTKCPRRTKLKSVHYRTFA